MPHKILVVDDHPDTAESIAVLLRMLGHDVYTALSALTAIVMARVHQPQVIFLDVNLGKDDGCELAETMKKELGLGSSRIYAITGNPREDTRERARRSGCDGYLLKPVDVSTFEALLR